MSQRIDPSARDLGFALVLAVFFLSSFVVLWLRARGMG